jgi:hypothetical protein
VTWRQGRGWAARARRCCAPLRTGAQPGAVAGSNVAPVAVRPARTGMSALFSQEPRGRSRGPRSAAERQRGRGGASRDGRCCGLMRAGCAPSPRTDQGAGWATHPQPCAAAASSQVRRLRSAAADPAVPPVIRHEPRPSVGQASGVLGAGLAAQHPEQRQQRAAEAQQQDGAGWTVATRSMAEGDQQQAARGWRSRRDCDPVAAERWRAPCSGQDARCKGRDSAVRRRRRRRVDDERATGDHRSSRLDRG